MCINVFSSFITYFSKTRLLTNFVSVLIAFLISACSGGESSSSGAVVAAPPAPALAPAPVGPVTLSNMTGFQSFTAHSSMFAGRNNDVNQYLNKSSQTDATVTFNNNTNQLRLVLSQQLTNNETFNLDATLDLDTDLISSTGGFMLLGRNIGNNHGLIINYIDPDSALPVVGQLDYVTGGLWILAELPPQSSIDAEGGFVIAGFETMAGDMPTTGNATYDIVGDAIISGQGSVLEATGSGTFDVSFATGTMTGTIPTVDLFDLFTTNFDSTVPGFTMNGSITNGQSNFSGTATRAATGGDPALNGTFAGSFYGPTADEIGGVFMMDSGGNVQATDLLISGGFIGKQQ